MNRRGGGTNEVPTGDVVLRGPTAVSRLLLELDEQWPTLRFLGFGFYYAWIWLCYDSTLLVPPATASAAGASPDTLFTMYLASTAALALSLIAAALVPDRSTRLVRSKAGVFCMSAVAGLSTVGVALTALRGATDPLFLLMCVLTGLGTAWVCLRLGTVYASAPSRKTAMHTAASFVAAGLLYFLAKGVPVELGLPVMALLPVLGALCTMTPLGEAAVAAERPQRSHLLPRGFLPRLISAIAVFSLVVGVTRGFSTLTQSAGRLDEQGTLVVFGMAVVALTVYLAVGFLGNDFDISRLYYPIIILAAAGILVVPMLDGSEGFSGAFIGVAYACFIMVMWCLLAHVAHVTGIAPVRVFGLGRGASALGTTLGWLLGSQLIAHQEADSSVVLVVSVVMVFMLFAMAMLVFNDRQIGVVLRAVGRQGGAVPLEDGDLADESADSLTGERTVGGADLAEGLRDVRPMLGADGDPARAHAGAWKRACLEIAETYGLSQRETDVLMLLAKGRTIGFIADDLNVSFNTAKSHIRHVYVKTGVHTRQELLDMVETRRAGE